MLDPADRRGVTPRVEARVENTLGKTPVQQWNTVAEIKGSERPGQVVILGAHLDSWDLGTGTTDNGTGSMVVLEAARAIARSGLKPKRTIRFILFSGEEEGLLGSRGLCRGSTREADSIQAVLVLDNGPAPSPARRCRAGRISRPLEALLAPVASLSADSVRERRQGRHRSPVVPPYGVPGFNFDQLRGATTTPTIPRRTPTTTRSRAT